MGDRAAMLWLVVGAGAAAAATGSVLAGVGAAPAVAALGTMLTFASLPPALRRVPNPVLVRSGRRGAERAAEVKRHTSMLCRS